MDWPVLLIEELLINCRSLYLFPPLLLQTSTNLQRSSYFSINTSLNHTFSPSHIFSAQILSLPRECSPRYPTGRQLSQQERRIGRIRYYILHSQTAQGTTKSSSSTSASTTSEPESGDGSGSGSA